MRKCVVHTLYSVIRAVTLYANDLPARAERQIHSLEKLLKMYGAS